MENFNPYQSPKVNLYTEDPQEYGELNWLSYKGRLNRLRYIAYFHNLLFFIILASIASLLTIVSTILQIIIGFLWIIIVISISILTTFWTIQRLHDLNINGQWVIVLWLLNILPSLITHFAYRLPENLINLIISIPLFFLLIAWILLVFIKGSENNNNYGAPPPPSTLSTHISAYIIPLILLTTLIAFFIIIGSLRNFD